MSTLVPGVTSVKPGDHVIPLYTPECRQCKFCTSGKTNLCQAIRETQGRGVMPDGTSRFSNERQTAVPLHGHVDVRELHRVAGNRRGENSRRRAIRQGVLHRLWRDDRALARCINTAKVEPGANVAVFGLGGIGLNVIQGARLVGANRIIGVDINPCEARLRKSSA